MDKDGNTRFRTKKERDEIKQHQRQVRRNVVNNAKERVRAKLDAYSANHCKNGEPIDMVTESYLIE